MDIIIIVLVVITVILLAFPFARLAKRWSAKEEAITRKFIRKHIKDEKKANKAYIAYRVIVAILIILTFMFVNGTLGNKHVSNEKPNIDSYRGYGGENINPINGGIKPTLEEIEADRLKVKPADEGDPIKVLTRSSSSGYEFLRDPDRARWYADGGGSELYFEIFVAKDPFNNILKTSFDNTSVKEAYKGSWSYLSNYILFSKIEGEHHEGDDHLHDIFIGNIWVVDINSGIVREVINLNRDTNIDYVSNEKKIAFVTTNTIEVINMDGTGRKVIYEFPEFDSRSEILYVPYIYMNDLDTFTAIIKDPNYFVNGNEETIRFSFDGERLN